MCSPDRPTARPPDVDRPRPTGSCGGNPRSCAVRSRRRTADRGRCPGLGPCERSRRASAPRVRSRPRGGPADRHHGPVGRCAAPTARPHRIDGPSEAETEARGQDRPKSARRSTTRLSPDLKAQARRSPSMRRAMGLIRLVKRARVVGALSLPSSSDAALARTQ